MKSEIYQNYEGSGDDTTKLKLKDLTIQILKNSVSMAQIVMGAHKILNSPEHLDFKHKNSMEQNLITLRNEFLTQSISNSNFLYNSLSNLRK